MVKLIALDLDGTLEDSRADMIAAIRRVRAELGLTDRRSAQLEPHVSRGMPHLYAVCFDDHLAAGGDPDALRTAYERDYSERIKESTRLYDGIDAALKQLAAVAPLAVVTNKPEALSELLLTALGVRQHFAVVVGGDTCEAPKPAATPLLFAMAAVGANPDTTIMIGDSAGDIACARAAGARVIWCAFGYKDAPGPTSPDAVAHTPLELVSLVSQSLLTV